MNRKDLYDKIKMYNLSSFIMDKEGRHYTNVSNIKLLDYVDNYVLNSFIKTDRKIIRKADRKIIRFESNGPTVSTIPPYSYMYKSHPHTFCDCYNDDKLITPCGLVFNDRFSLSHERAIRLVKDKYGFIVEKESYGDITDIADINHIKERLHIFADIRFSITVIDKKNTTNVINTLLKNVSIALGFDGYELYSWVDKNFKPSTPTLELISSYYN